MARIFTIQFTHEEETYNILVAVKTTPLFIAYTLLNLDIELLTQLPGNTLISTSPRMLQFQNDSPGLTTALMASILKAVSRHLQTLPGLITPGSID